MWIPVVLVGIIVMGSLFLNQTLMAWPTCGNHPNAICSVNQTMVVWGQGCYGQSDTLLTHLPSTFPCCTTSCRGGRVFGPDDGANYRQHLYMEWRFLVNIVRLGVIIAATNLVYRFWRVCQPYRLTYKPMVAVVWGSGTVTLQPDENCISKPCRGLLMAISLTISVLSIVDPGYYAPIFLAVVGAVCLFALFYVWDLQPPIIKIHSEPLTHLLIAGTHPRLGKDSTIREFFRDNTLSEPRLLGVISQFMVGWKGDFVVEVGPERYRLPATAFRFKQMGHFSEMRINIYPRIYVHFGSWELEGFGTFFNDEIMEGHSSSQKDVVMV